MLSESINTLRFLQGYVDNQLAEISDDDFYSQPVDGANHAAWNLGHTAYYLDQHIAMIGGGPQLEAWKETFGQHSTPTTGPDGYPSREEIISAWREAGNRLIAAVEAASDEQLTAPNPNSMADAFPTVGDFLAFSLATHSALHVGQISMWRRLVGQAAMF